MEAGATVAQDILRLGCLSGAVRVTALGAGECFHGSCWCGPHSVLPGVECIGKQTGASSRVSSESACLSPRVPPSFSSAAA